jgi:uncharacterized protein
MSGDGPHEGEYPGQMGMPFEDAPARGAAGGRAPGPGESRRAGGGAAPGPDDDLFVWNDLRPPRREQSRRPAESENGDWSVREFGAPGAGGGRRDDDAARRERDDLDRRYARDARDADDWRAPEYPTSSRRQRYEPADGYETSEEWEEWLEPEAPHGAETIGSLPERHTGPRRRRLSAGAVLLAMLLGFFLAGLFDVQNIKKDVEARPYGALRSLQLALLAPMSGLSRVVRADDLSTAVADALGRGEGTHHTLAQVAKTKPLWPRKITAAKPLRLYVAGDSMDQVYGSSLVNLSEATGLVKAKNDYKVSSGLSRPDFFDWPQRLIDQMVDYKPDAVSVLFGANDGQDVLDPATGQVLKVGTKAWQQVYAQRVGAAMDILTKGGRRVYWVGNPIMHDAGYRDRIAMMDHIYEAEAKKHPGVTFISTWKLFSDPKGAYSDYLKDANGDSVLMRAPDGIHLTRAGGDRMAALVLGVIEKDWGMTSSSSASPSPAP